MTFDVLIRGGTIIDGTGSPRRAGDVGIRGDRIAAVGHLHEASAKHTLDASGRIVAPGFLDVHNHSDGWMLKRRHLAAKTLQGFTTEVLMSDGISYAPVDVYTARQWLFYLRALDGLRVDEYSGWQSLADFTALIDRCNVQNCAVQIPYANVRSLVCGFGRVAVDDFHRRQIRLEIRRGMERGAVGLSTGLDYIVQCFSTTDELVEACRVVAEHGGVYATHVRYKLGLIEALDEALDIARRSSVKLHISHLKGPSAEMVEQVLAWLDKARRDVDLSFDVYPYQPGSTMLSYLLPYEAWEDGPLAAPARLGVPRIRTLLKYGLEAYRLKLDRLRIAWVAGKENACWQGRYVSEYVEARGIPAEDALADLLIEERLGVLMVVDEGDDVLVRPMLQHDLCVIGSDGIYQDDGPVHPRVFGTAGRILGPCVRDWKLFSLEAAVRKLSGASAERFGLTDRGVLQEGAAADLVVFNPDTVCDRATYGEPRQPTVGIDHVLVAGRPIIDNGKPVEAFDGPLPGRYLTAEFT